LLLSNISRRAEKKVRSIFIKTINDGGLFLLNELVVDNSAREIIEVLKLLADANNHPVAMYCTAGKPHALIVVCYGHTTPDALNNWICWLCV